MAYKKMRPRKKVCYFKKNKITHIDFKDVELLSRFINPDGKISSRRWRARCSFPGSLVPEITTRSVLHGPPRRGPFLMPWRIAWPARNASQASPDKTDGACVFLMRGCLGMGKGSFEKTICRSRGTWHDRLGREKIVVSGRMGPCGDN